MSHHFQCLTPSYLFTGIRFPSRRCLEFAGALNCFASRSKHAAEPPGAADPSPHNGYDWRSHMSQKMPSAMDTKSGFQDDELWHTSRALCPEYSLTTSCPSLHHWCGSSPRFLIRRLRTGSILLVGGFLGIPPCSRFLIRGTWLGAVVIVGASFDAVFIGVAWNYLSCSKLALAR